MGRFIGRRLVQAVFTIFGVMVVTFLLFRVMAADIAAAHVGAKATEQTKAAWRHRYGYDKPLLVNVHNRIRITDKTEGDRSLLVSLVGEAAEPEKLVLLPSADEAESKRIRYSRYYADLNRTSLLLRPTHAPLTGKLKIQTSDRKELVIELTGLTRVGGLLDRINDHPDNKGPLVVADIAKPTLAQAFDSQFFDHLINAVTFQSRSLRDGQSLTEIIAKRAPKSLALTVPAMAIGWISAMIISCFVAYYRDTSIDKVGVFLSVLGMCIPFLAWMIIGQWLMFVIAPQHAYGLAYRGNIYVPIAIMVIAGLGGSVRFYRTVILDEINRDYVRTARAKGVSLPGILFKHVLKNCMLPILTNLILAIPFLIMGSLLVESYFGVPGLGDLMLSSINGRDEPVISGLVFLSALIYTIGLLITDVSYAVFDPRIRLR